MYKILLVDDEILVRDAIRENIDWKSLDCELVGDCENGRQAVEFVQSHKVDVVLTDICMPYMDGMELSEFLHDNYPDILIVIFSGFGEFEYAKKAIRYNVSEYMLKPVTAMELTKVLRNMKEKLDSRKKKQKKWMRRIENKKAVPGVWLLTLPSSQQNNLDVIPADLLLQPAVRRNCPMIVGLAVSREEAFELCGGDRIGNLSGNRRSKNPGMAAEPD